MVFTRGLAIIFDIGYIPGKRQLNDGERGFSMKNRRYSVRKKPFRKVNSDKSAEEIAREIKQSASPSGNYREMSLRIHGLICAKCAREFTQSDRHLLTVHHKDGNPRNNPTDGSNWENLCVYCHEDSHSRGMLGDFLRDK